MNVYLALSCLLIFLILYFIMAQYFGHRRFNYLQETAVAIIVGIIVGVLIFQFTDFFQQNNGDSQGFIRDMIILILLPPIMFEDGYNFPRRKFFQNILYINLYGLLGTILNFFIIWGMLYGFNQAKLFVSVSDAKQSIVLNNWQLLLIATALCSIEPIVTQKAVDKERYPKLFSIVFGQALFKDTLAVTFYQSIIEEVENTTASSFDIGGEEVGMLLLKFLQVIVCSILLGVAMGVLLTIVFKNMRFLVKQKGISQMALTIVVGFLCYVLSEWIGWSGVISMLFCGTVMAHYNSYNLTDQGKQTTLVTIEVLKIAASGIISFFIGFEIFNVQSFTSIVDGLGKLSFSLALLGFTFLALIVARVINVFFVSLLGWLLTKKENWRLNMYEICIVFLAGLVHGAVPFALAVNIPIVTGDVTSNCTQLNIVIVVMITSLIFNIFIPKLQKILLAQIRQMQKNQANHPSIKQSFGINLKHDSHNTADIQQIATPLLDKFKSSTQKYWRKFEQGVLKPFLIYNYRERRDQIKMEKVRLRYEEHRRYMERFADPENILNADDQEQNKFIEIKHSEHAESKGQGEQGIMKIKKEKQLEKSKKQLLLQIKSDKSKKKQKSQQKQINVNKSSDQDRSLSAKTFRLSEKLQRRKYRLSSHGQMKRPSQTEIVSLSSKKKEEPADEPVDIKIQIRESAGEKVEQSGKNE